MSFFNFNRLSERELLELLLHKVTNLERNSGAMSKQLDDLTAEVAAEQAVEASAVALINGLAAQIAAAGTDPAALSALTASIKTSSDQLAAAITANTSAPAAG